MGTRQLLDRAAELLILLRQRLDDVAGYPISTADRRLSVAVIERAPLSSAEVLRARGSVQLGIAGERNVLDVLLA